MPSENKINSKGVRVERLELASASVRMKNGHKICTACHRVPKRVYGHLCNQDQICHLFFCKKCLRRNRAQPLACLCGTLMSTTYWKSIFKNGEAEHYFKNHTPFIFTTAQMEAFSKQG